MKVILVIIFVNVFIFLFQFVRSLDNTTDIDNTTNRTNTTNTTQQYLNETTTETTEPDESESETSTISYADRNKFKEYEEYNKLYMEGYMQMMRDVEDEDRQLKAYDAGDQPTNHKMDWQIFMNRIPVLKNMLGKTCYKDIGCFSALDFQDFVDRPISVLPMTPEFITPDYFLYTKDNMKKPIQFKYNPTKAQLTKSSFNPQFRTVVIIHGFRSGLEPWMEGLKDMLFDQAFSDYNVICVDWHKGAKVPSYSFAAANTRVVGALTAFFINRIVETFKISNKNFYLIGHSLGAHTCGYAGARLYNPKVSRITGLDPAGPAFYKNDPRMRLDPSDAQEVDIIHTDMAHTLTDGLGITDPIGDFDFYPNGGKLQPGCSPAGVKNFVKAAVTNDDMSCSHTRAHDLAKAFGDAKSRCLPIGYLCKDYDTFLEGRCGDCGKDSDKCRVMGVYPLYWQEVNFTKKNIPQKYYLNTAAVKEFCVFHYQIALHISDTSNSASGRFSLTLTSTLRDKPRNYTVKRLITQTEPGDIHTMLITFPFNMQLGPISMAFIEWKKFVGTEKVQLGKIMEIRFIEVNFMSHIVKKVRERNSFILCPPSENQLELDGDPLKYIPCQSDTKPDRLARNTGFEHLKPVTYVEDINNVDYASLEKIERKEE